MKEVKPGSGQGQEQEVAVGYTANHLCFNSVAEKYSGGPGRLDETSQVGIKVLMSK